VVLFTKLAAGIALHGLGLAIPREVVWSTALIARSGARTTAEAAPEAPITTPRTASSPSNSSAGGRAVAGQMASQTTAVAPSASSSTAQAESRAVGLDVSKALTVVALFRFGGAGMRTSVRLMARLLAVIAEPLRRRAHLCRCQISHKSFQLHCHRDGRYAPRVYVLEMRLATAFPRSIPV
jgi:hypothetical protein